MKKVEEIELAFDPQLNRIATTLVELVRARDYLAESEILSGKVKDMMINNLTEEIEHMRACLTDVQMAMETMIDEG